MQDRARERVLLHVTREAHELLPVHLERDQAVTACLLQDFAQIALGDLERQRLACVPVEHHRHLAGAAQRLHLLANDLARLRRQYDLCHRFPQMLKLNGCDETL